MCNRNLDDCIHVPFLPHRALEIFTIGKQVNRAGEYGLKIPANFLYGPKKA